LIVDTVDALEPMLLEDVCLKHGWKNIEQPPYGKGWVLADETWRRFVRGVVALRDKHGMTIALVAHATIERVDDPRAPSFTSYWPKLHKRARHLVLDACDLVGFLAEDLRIATDDRERVRATSSNQRFLFVEGCPAYVGKNRYGMPAKIPIGVDFNVGELTKYWQRRGKMTELSTVLNEAFDVATEEGSPDFEPLPRGSYVASITDAKVGPLKSGKGQAVLLTWQVDDDKYGGRLIFDRIIVAHESPEAMKFGRRRLKDTAEACGVKDSITDLTVLQNKPCLVTVKIEEDPDGQYAPKNRVTRVRPITKEPPKANGKPDFDDKINF
jgi:hypothetical protein